VRQQSLGPIQDQRIESSPSHPASSNRSMLRICLAVWLLRLPPRGVRSVRFGQCENRPGPMASSVERQLREYANGTRTSFDLPWDVEGTPFQLQVWRALFAIPYGETRSYADIARAVQKPKGAQAVGQANSRNPLLIIIPCHRVINADGSLGGWGPGEDKKQLLLTLEIHYSHLAERR
jgi:methylated-DNA-[protein]-cysteine S-methyltransferase